MRAYLGRKTQPDRFVFSVSDLAWIPFMRPIYWLTIVCCASLASCSTPQEKSEQAAATAAALVEAGKFEEARPMILEAISQRDDVVSQWELLGRIGLETGKPADALLAYSRVLELDATNVNALQLVAELSFQFGHTREARDAADRLLALNPDATRAILVKGLVALDQKRATEALAAADAILKIDPQDELGIVLKARSVAIGRDYKGALKLIEEGVPDEQRTEASLATLTELYRSLGDTERLIATIDRQLLRRPNDVDLKLDFAKILYKSGKSDRARSILYQIVNAQPDNIEVLGQVSDIWTENDPSALTSTQLAAIAQNGSTAVRSAVARYLIDRGQPDLAEPVLRGATAKKADVSATEAQALYATALYRKGNVKAARAMAEKILLDDRDNSDALLLRAQIGLQERNFATALNDAQIVVRDFPMNEQGRIVLGDIFLAKKEPQRARLSYEEAINELPQSLLLHRVYSTYLIQSGDKPRAIDVARTFTRKNPSSVQGWALLQNVCRQAGDEPCAARAQAARDKASAIYTVDDRPGSIRSRGLFGRLQ